MLVKVSFESDPAFITLWNEFKAMRKKKKKAMTESVEERQLKKVRKLYEGLGSDLPKLLSHLELVCDKTYDSIYANNEHYSNIINLANGKGEISTTDGPSYGGNRQGKNKGNSNGGGFKQAVNYYTFDKNEKYFDSAEKLRVAANGFDFVSRVAEK
jgi:hypothetical protein